MDKRRFPVNTFDNCLKSQSLWPRCSDTMIMFCPRQWRFDSGTGSGNAMLEQVIQICSLVRMQIENVDNGLHTHTHTQRETQARSEFNRCILKPLHGQLRFLYYFTLLDAFTATFCYVRIYWRAVTWPNAIGILHFQRHISIVDNVPQIMQLRT